MKVLSPAAQNLLDFYSCSICRQDVYKVSHNTAASQIMKVMEVMLSLLGDTIVNTGRRSKRGSKTLHRLPAII